MMRLPAGPSMFVRSLFVQSSWSFRGMQNLGFFLMVMPALLRRHARGSAELAEAAQRNLQVFNTHPYFAGLVAATVVHEEEGGGDPAFATGLKRSLMCSLGAVGDDFFWAHLRPAAALLALPFAAVWRWAPLVMLVAYNVPHLAVRVWGIQAGLARGRGVIGVLQRQPLRRAVPLLATTLTFLAGALIGFSGGGAWGALPAGGAISWVVTAGVFLGLVWLLARGVAYERLLLSASAAALAAAAVAWGLAP